MNIKRYAIIDTVIETEFASLLERFDPPCACLYAEPLTQEIAACAPHLIEINDTIDKWLRVRTERAWGVYFDSAATMRDLRQHFRKYLQVQIPDQTKPVFFRFYDPRVIWNVVDILDDWQLFRFVQPIEKIVTYYQGQEREQTFSALKNQYPQDMMPARKILTFSQAQYDVFNQIAKENYLSKLIDYAMSRWEQQNIDMQYQHKELKALIADSLSFCHRQNITDDRSIKLLIEMFVAHGVMKFEQIPQSWRSVLNDDRVSGTYRMMKLAFNELEALPAYQ